MNKSIHTKLGMVASIFVLAGCQAGLFHEDVINSKGMNIEVFGAADHAEATVTARCTNASNGDEIVFETFTPLGWSAEMGSTTVYPWTGEVTVPDECWTCEDCENADTIPQSTSVRRRYFADVWFRTTTSFGGTSPVYTATREEANSCVAENSSDIGQVVKNCELVQNSRVYANRELQYRLTQASRAPYKDGINKTPEELAKAAALRARWLQASGLEEVWFGYGGKTSRDRLYPNWKLPPHNTFRAYWEASLSVGNESEERFQPLVLSFAGSEPPDFEAGDVGDLSDFSADSDLTLTSPNEALFATDAQFENLCSAAGCGIHNGFLSYASNLWMHARETESSEGLLYELRKHYSRQDPRPFYLTGHSLGGSIAVIIASYIESERLAGDDSLPAVSGVFAYGAPMVGNEQWQSFYNEQLNLGNRTKFISIEGDPGPRYPRDYHPCEYLFADHRIKCWIFAEGDINTWNSQRESYRPVGVEYILSETGLTQSNHEPWSDFDESNHELFKYMRLLSDCELRPGRCF